jgi:hypothetical protein
MSTAADRLAVIYQAYKSAKANRSADLKAAKTEDQVEAILANIDALNTSYLAAADADLSVTSPDIEAAYTAAKQAADDADAARKAAQALPAIITRMTHLADTVKTLISDITGAGG